MSVQEDFEKWHKVEFSRGNLDYINDGLYYFDDVIQRGWHVWQACAAHYEAELLKRDALIAEKDKALKAAQVSIGRLTSDEGSIQEDFDNEDTIQHALSLTHDSVRLVEAARVGKLVNSVCLDSTNAEKRWDYLPIGTKLYTIVKGASE